MIAVIVYPAKTKDKEYPYYKEPRKVLEVSDMEVAISTKQGHGIYYWIHWTEDYDKLSDKELVQKYNEKNSGKIEIASRRSGEGYTTADKENLVRIIRNTYDWMMNARGK